MKTLLFFITFILFIIQNNTVFAKYDCIVNSATNEINYRVTKMNNNFSKIESIEFGKVVNKENSSVYYVIPVFWGNNFGKKFLSDIGEIVIDNSSYEIHKDTNAKHIYNTIVKWNVKGGSKYVLFSEYSIPETIAEKIKTSKGNIIFKFNIEEKGLKELDFGINTSDEIRFIIDKKYEDYIPVTKKKIKPKYTEIDK